MASTFGGSLHTIAPEVLEGKKYTFSADIWSLGCILYELYIGDSPFMSSSEE
jgi:novel protein kinase C delta type